LTELIESHSAAETEALGARIAASLEPGAIVVVCGDLGAGKTTLVRGACRALGVEEPVTSPTFTIGQRYRGDGVLVSHLDLYRLSGGLEDEDPGLLDDYLSPDTIAFVEWPAAAAGKLRQPALEVRIRHRGGDSREIDLDSASSGA
jgi:tRNA threonylcarbamoyladenosine biosynthesis protein TsaE